MDIAKSVKELRESTGMSRKEFSELNIKNIDPIQAITAFEHVMDITSKFELKTINVRESENRKIESDKQENQTEFYTV